MGPPSESVKLDARMMQITVNALWYLLTGVAADVGRAVNYATEDISAEIGNWDAESYRVALLEKVRAAVPDSNPFTIFTGHTPNPYRVNSATPYRRHLSRQAWIGTKCS